MTVNTGVGAPAQYGPGVRGLASYLLAGQYLQLARTVALTELVGAPISEGVTFALVRRRGRGLGRFDGAAGGG